MRGMIKGMVAAVALAGAPPAAAEDNYLELWLHPSVVKDVGKKSFLEAETQLRFRDGPAPNQHVARLWAGHKVGNGITLMAGLHRGWEGDTRETRLMQQASYPLGPLNGRTRLEQRFFNDQPRTGWRIRQRVGVAVPLGKTEGGWELAANAEGFFTLRAASAGGQTGLTGLRTFVGFEREFDQVAVDVGYTRQQNIRRGSPDRVGHAPTLGLTLNL